MRERNYLYFMKLLFSTLHGTSELCPRQPGRAWERLHDSIISIDTHNDFAMFLAFPTAGPRWPRQVSFELMKEGRLDGVFFVALLGSGPCTTRVVIMQNILQTSMLRALHRYARENRDLGGIAYCPEDIRELKKQGKAAMLLSH